MKQNTKITVEYDLKDIENALRSSLSADGFVLEYMEPKLSVIGGDRHDASNAILKSIVCHVTKKPPYVPGPYGDR